jgi:cell division protein FtsN
MSDWTSGSEFRNPDDPYRRDAYTDPDARAANAVWGWIAAAVFVVVILAVAFGMSHQPGQDGANVASNTPAATRMAPPSGTPAPSTPANPARPAPNSAPAPTEPSTGH